jgi:Phospholipid methyltransferase
VPPEFLGAWSFAMRDLLGISQMQAWVEGRPVSSPHLKTGRLYRWLRHPMYIGVLVGVWATPRMSVGHLLLAWGFTTYVFIAMRLGGTRPRDDLRSQLPPLASNGAIDPPIWEPQASLGCCTRRQMRGLERVRCKGAEIGLSM